jgi:RNA polymerase sigma-70 factor, ECF subfamily
MDPEQLIAAARAGEESAARELIDLFYRRIYGFLFRLAGNAADAADLTQRTFTKAWQGLPGFAGRASVASWLHSIAYHVFLDWRRADKHTDPRPNEWWAAIPSAEASPAQSLAGRDLAGHLYAAVDRLEPTLRESVHLHYYQELTLEETANAMNVAVSTVKYRLRQALQELQKQMAEPALPRQKTFNRLCV